MILPLMLLPWSGLAIPMMGGESIHDFVPALEQQIERLIVNGEPVQMIVHSDHNDASWIPPPSYVEPPPYSVLPPDEPSLLSRITTSISSHFHSAVQSVSETASGVSSLMKTVKDIRSSYYQYLKDLKNDVAIYPSFAEATRQFVSPQTNFIPRSSNYYMLDLVRTEDKIFAIGEAMVAEETLFVGKDLKNAKLVTLKVIDYGLEKDPLVVAQLRTGSLKAHHMGLELGIQDELFEINEKIYSVLPAGTMLRRLLGHFGSIFDGQYEIQLARAARDFLKSEFHDKGYLHGNPTIDSFILTGEEENQFGDLTYKFYTIDLGKTRKVEGFGKGGFDAEKFKTTSHSEVRQLERSIQSELDRRGYSRVRI